MGLLLLTLQDLTGVLIHLQLLLALVVAIGPLLRRLRYSAVHAVEDVVLALLRTRHGAQRRQLNVEFFAPLVRIHLVRLLGHPAVDQQLYHLGEFVDVRAL